MPIIGLLLSLIVILLLVWAVRRLFGANVGIVGRDVVWCLHASH